MILVDVLIEKNKNIFRFEERRDHHVRYGSLCERFGMGFFYRIVDDL